METLQEILLLLLTIGGLVLVVMLITVLVSMRKALQTIGSDIRKLSDQSMPILEQVKVTIEQTGEALTVITDNRETLAAAAENVRKVTENIYRLESILQDQIEPSAIGLARRLAGLRRGIDTFLAQWRQGR